VWNAARAELDNGDFENPQTLNFVESSLLVRLRAWRIGRFSAFCDFQHTSVFAGATCSCHVDEWRKWTRKHRRFGKVLLSVIFPETLDAALGQVVCLLWFETAFHRFTWMSLFDFCTEKRSSKSNRHFNKALRCYASIVLNCVSTILETCIALKCATNNRSPKSDLFSGWICRYPTSPYSVHKINYEFCQWITWLLQTRCQNVFVSAKATVVFVVEIVHCAHYTTVGSASNLWDGNLRLTAWLSPAV